MAQTVRIFVLDQDEAPLEGATVVLHNTVDASTYSQISDVDGLALFGAVTEGTYVLSARRNGYTAPAHEKLQVTTPPAAQPAKYIPDAGADFASVSASRKAVRIAVGVTEVDVDVSGGDDTVLSVTELVVNINLALAAENPTWSGVAINTYGAVQLRSPDTGESSRVAVISDGTLIGDAADIIFGIELGSGTVEAFGSDAIANYHDYEIALTETGFYQSVDPSLCTIWGRLFRTETTTVAYPMAFHVTNKGAPIGTPLGLDVGDSFYVNTDKDGYVRFEAVRGTQLTAYFPTLDLEIEFTVPARASAEISSILTPYETSLTITEPTAPVSMEVGATIAPAITAGYSNGDVKGTNTAITLTSSDGAILTAADGVVTAVAAGSATITASLTNVKGQTITSAALTIEVS